MAKRAAARLTAELQANAPALGKEMSRGLPNPTVTGPCQAQATFMCTGEARGAHLNPLAMLPGSEVPTDYVPMCPACKEHLSDAYVTALHSGGN